MGKVVLFGQKLLFSGKSSCIRAREVVFGDEWLYSVDVVLFGQKWLYSGKRGCIPAKWLYWGKVVVFGQKWMYS